MRHVRVVHDDSPGVLLQPLAHLQADERTPADTMHAGDDTVRVWLTLMILS
jgi:hypothetical protein